MTLPQTTTGIVVANGTATITIDRGSDGTVDRTITSPMAQFVAAIG